MQKAKLFYSAVLCVLVAGTMPCVHAQTTDRGKPPSYTYVSEWSVPRAQGKEMEKLDEMDRSLLDRLVADGTLMGYGSFSNLIHQEGEPTHGTWFTAASEGKLLKTLEALYANPGSTDAPVEGASKHWDYMLVGRTYNQKSGKSEGGYLAGDQWVVKPGHMRAFNEMMKATMIPEFDKLMAEGVVSAYWMGTEDFHTGKIGRVLFYFTTPDAEAFDRASKALDESLDKNPTFGGAFESMVESEGHRDFLDRVRFMNNR